MSELKFDILIRFQGFFGKGSLSKSYPSFGRSKYGAPAVVSNRQWQRRQEWINEVRKLSQETNFNNVKNDSDDDQGKRLISVQEPNFPNSCFESGFC